jgi:hypothetical protein
MTMSRSTSTRTLFFVLLSYVFVASARADSGFLVQGFGDSGWAGWSQGQATIAARNAAQVDAATTCNRALGSISPYVFHDPQVWYCASKTLPGGTVVNSCSGSVTAWCTTH